MTLKCHPSMNSCYKRGREMARKANSGTRNIGKYKKRGEPNETQKDCMRRGGNCLGCPNQLESQQCQVFDTDEVATFLALPQDLQQAYLWGLS